MDLQLRGRQALITGAGSGIGQGIAVSLAAEGTKVAITATSEAGLAETAELVERAGGPAAVPITGDLTLEADIDAIARLALERLPELDILVNNAGGSRPMHGMGVEEDWEESFSLNFSAARRLTARLRDNVCASGRGRIIFVTGASTVRAVNAAAPAKAALQSLARTLSLELAENGVTVNCIAPGRIDSRQIREHLHPTEESRQQYIRQNIPMGRFGTPAELADLVAFLASPRAAYISGASIPVDGGMLRLA